MSKRTQNSNNAKRYQSIKIQKTQTMKSIKFILTSTSPEHYGKFLTVDGEIQKDDTPLSEQMLFNTRQEALDYRDINEYFAMQVSEAIPNQLKH